MPGKPSVIGRLADVRMMPGLRFARPLPGKSRQVPPRGVYVESGRDVAPALTPLAMPHRVIQIKFKVQ